MKTVLLATLFAASSFAGVSDFDSLKKACMNPASVGNQIAPRTIQVSCTDVRTAWKPGTTSSNGRTMKNYRKVTSAFTTDKGNISPVTQDLAISDDRASQSCPSFDEMLVTTSISQNVACADVIAHKGNQTEFCTDILAKAGDRALVRETETGRNFNVCENKYGQSNPGRGQRN